MNHKRIVLFTLALCFLMGFLAHAHFETYENVPVVYSTLNEYQEVTGKDITSFNEAPMLKELVEAGVLPPVDERLPKDFMVVDPAEAIGVYGGNWVSARTAPTGWAIYRMAQGLMARRPGTYEIMPNLLKDYEIKDNSTKFIFYMREGLRWSDGEPFTVDDILWYFEHAALNEDINPGFRYFNRELMFDDEVIYPEKIDDYTFQFVFPEPNVYFEEREVMIWHHTMDLVYPSHYLKQYHPEFTSEEELKKKVDESGLDHWADLFNRQRMFLQNPDLPSLDPWVVSTDYAGTELVFERNPYYWKVDTEGNQLPYIDSKTSILVEASEAVILLALSGDLDYQVYNLGIMDYPTIVSEADRGGYVPILYSEGRASAAAFMFNQNHKEPAKREIFQDKRFRQALSLAINRDEINEMAFYGAAEIRQAAFNRESIFYCEDWDQAFVEFDPKRANALLDEIGLDRRDRDGFRLLPNGDPLHITVELVSVNLTEELVQSYWRDIGLNVTLRPQETSLMYERTAAADFDAYSRHIDRFKTPHLDTRWWVPYAHLDFHWAPEWGRYYQTGGAAGQEPPDEVKRLQEIWSFLPTTGVFEDQQKLMQEVAAIHAENIWMIGTVGGDPSPGLRSQNLINTHFPVSSHTFRNPIGTALPEQFFFQN